VKEFVNTPPVVAVGRKSFLSKISNTLSTVFPCFWEQGVHLKTGVGGHSITTLVCRVLGRATVGSVVLANRETVVS